MKTTIFRTLALMAMLSVISYGASNIVGCEAGSIIARFYAIQYLTNETPSITASRGANNDSVDITFTIEQGDDCYAEDTTFAPAFRMVSNGQVSPISKTTVQKDGRNTTVSFALSDSDLSHGGICDVHQSGSTVEYGCDILVDSLFNGDKIKTWNSHITAKLANGAIISANAN